MTNLRRRMLEELQRRNYSPATIRGYLHAVEQFAKHFGKSPDKLGPDDLRSYQAYLLTERKLAVGSVVARVAALRFFFVRTLKRREFRVELPYPKDSKVRRRLPTVLSLEEVARLIDAAGNLMQRALLMTLYGTGMRRTEVSLLKVSDIDSRRMMIRVERGKGGGGRDLPLSPALLETLREYWRWRECPRFCVNAVPLVSASVVGASPFLLVTLMPRIVGIIWPVRSAVKAPCALFSRRLYSASRVESALSATSSSTLRSALPRQRPDHA